jgi:hypothetical protein
LILLLFSAAIPSKKPVLASQALPWMQPEPPQDDTLKECLPGRTDGTGGVTLLAANLWTGLHHDGLYARAIKSRHTFVLDSIKQKLQMTLSCHLQLLLLILYCG